MKLWKTLVFTVILAVSCQLMARDKSDVKDDKDTKTENVTTVPEKNVKPVRNNKSVLININRPSSGRNNRNFPSRQQKPADLQKSNPSLKFGTPQNTSPVPVYGNLQITPSQPEKNTGAWNTGKTPGSFGNSANVVHHHPYEQNYVRKRLKKLGVQNAPGYILNREDVIHTDRGHSFISYPKEDFNHHPLNGTMVSSRHFNDQTVRSHMAQIEGNLWQQKIRVHNWNENTPNQYYWHHDRDFNYCHFVDASGYHWYGWYLGDKYFWVRNFNDRWWWYDADFDRWCFWNNGFWWWQDPYHMGDLYCYNDANYIPCNSADDNVAVTVPDVVNMQSFTSPDNTRIVKIATDTQDAFLYDTADPPAFNPTYLASGVKDVMFSDTKNGRPLEIILKLNDGSFDMFDGSGRAYNPGTSETN